MAPTILNARTIASGFVAPERWWRTYKTRSIARHRSFWAGVLPLLLVTPAVVLIEAGSGGRLISGLMVGGCALFAGAVNFAACTRMIEQTARLFQRPASQDASYVATCLLQTPLWLGMSLLMLPIEQLGLSLAYAFFTLALFLVTLRQSWACFFEPDTRLRSRRTSALLAFCVAFLHLAFSGIIWGVLGLFAAILGLGLSSPPGR